jgi:hypothetical protein
LFNDAPGNTDYVALNGRIISEQLIRNERLGYWPILGKCPEIFVSGTEETATAGLLFQAQMIGGGDCGEIGGMKIGRGNRSTRRKPALSTTNPT